ncbi:Maf family protein [Candidatus Nitrospira nitrificans]|uniref:dTTP/UTP pyrophosphatase n=1 Tax=Candidatus Nitrospira nitrificans TaxID=1742973 RepID=A0A0S4LN32_9BACT|nr:Maf family protein [Candidatus Nitrospira nitrificans]CUS37355.1 Maf-like protein Psyr_4160 [Candidatus Nitrospira nitrificans]
MQLVLASSSPRRRELLTLLGLSFEVCSPEFHEHPTVGWPPIEQVRHFAREKARSVACARSRTLVLGSDTVIDLDGRLLGKPVDLAEARAMLADLAGRSHQVHTAVALCDRERHIESAEVATAEVWMKADLDHAYEQYLASEESLGKAGAYAIQGLGGELVERIVGDYTTVVGLPLKLVAHLLQSAGYPLLVNVEGLYRRKPYANWNRFAS